MPEAAVEEREVVRAQPGPQELALDSDADVVIFGGAAGGGKTFSIFLSVVQHQHLPGFGAEVFRRTTTDITKTGGLWAESFKVFPDFGAASNQNQLRWTFPSGATCTFSHMEHEADRFNWKGAQIPFAAFDQLETFTAEQFWYLQSRLRDPSGTVRPWTFATCNPVPSDDPVGGWLRVLIDWWIGEDGLAIPERSGVVRWAVREGDELVWGDSREALAARYGAERPRSFTFIESRLEDNPALERADPGYRSRLMLLPLVERERLLGRNWNVRPTAGKVFNRAWFSAVDAAPRSEDVRRVRYWDKAATPEDVARGRGAHSAGVLVAYSADRGLTWVEDVVRGQWSAGDREKVIKQTAEADGPEVEVWEEQEPGSGGKESAEATIRNLAGFAIRAERVTGSKYARAAPLSAQAEAGNVRYVRGAWNEAWLREAHAFTGTGAEVCDQVDATAGAFNKLARGGGPVGFVALGVAPRATGAASTLRADVE